MANITLSDKFNIPEIVIQRLSLYLRILDQLSQGGGRSHKFSTIK